MPNHITTQVEISGTKELIAKLIKDTKIKLETDVEDNQFDFNGIIPMPEELRRTVSPTEIVETQEEADVINAQYAKDMAKYKQNETTKAITQEERARRIKKYGAENWYEFANNQWGTKWNAYEVHYTAHTDTTLVIQFDTAWDTPRAIWDKLDELGYTVKGIIYGEMDGYEFIGDGQDVWEAYTSIDVEYVG